MGLSDLWKKFIRDEEPETEDKDGYYRPRKKAGNPTLVDDPDDDMLRRPGGRAAGRMSDYNDGLDLEDDVYSDGVGRPRFKKVVATSLGSAEHAVDLVCQRYVVLINTEQLTDDMLAPFRCYIAGAVQVLGGHITPVDDENVFVSIEAFDATPYMPAQDDLAEQTDDLI